MLADLIQIDKQRFRSLLQAGKNYEWIKEEETTVDWGSPILTDQDGRRYLVKLSKNNFRNLLAKQLHIFYQAPVDVIEVSSDNSRFIQSCKERLFSGELEENTMYYAYLFPADKLLSLPSLREVLRELKRQYRVQGRYSVNWKLEQIRHLVTSIIDCLVVLQDAGYFCYDICQEHFFVTPENKILLAFHDRIAKIDKDVWDKTFSIEYRSIGRESWAVAQANHGLAALLFHLLYSRFPYDSPYLSIIEEDKEEHPKRYEHVFQLYHAEPVFLYDEKNAKDFVGEHSTSLSDWKDSPKQVQFIFKHIFTNFPDNIPFPNEWKNYLEVFASSEKGEG